MTAVVDKWTSATSGLWNTGTNWSLGFAPLPAETVLISPTSPLTVTLQGTPLTIAGLRLLGATLEDAFLYVTGTAYLRQATLEGGGGVRLEGSAVISGLTVDTNTQLNVNGGTATERGADVVLNGTSALTITNGGVWDIVGRAGILAAEQASPTAVVLIGQSGFGTGLLEKTGGGLSIVSADVFNNSADTTAASGVTYLGVEVTAGKLDLQGRVFGTQQGSDNIVGAATLEFDGSVSNQTVSFYGSGGVLELTALSQFHAAIVGFDTVGSDDVLLLGGNLTFAGAQEGATSATLAFTSAQGASSLTLTGDYQGGTFHAHQLASGLLRITYS